MAKPKKAAAQEETAKGAKSPPEPAKDAKKGKKGERDKKEEEKLGASASAGKDKKGKKKEDSGAAPAGENTRAAEPPPPGYIELKPFQRTPKQLLHNYCQKHKLPKPRFEQKRANAPGRFKTECIMPHAKDATKTMKFLTEQDWEFKTHSEHFSALLALHFLEPTRPYEKLFPSPFREAWLALAPSPAPAREKQAVPSARRLPVSSLSPAPAPTCAAAASPPSASSVSSAASPGSAREKKSGKKTSSPSAAAAPNASSSASPSPPAEPAAPPAVFAISSARQFASEYHRKQEADARRVVRAQKERRRELAQEQRRSQEPTVYMASAVREAVRGVLRKALQRLAVAAPSSASSAAPPSPALSASGFVLPPLWHRHSWRTLAASLLLSPSPYSPSSFLLSDAFAGRLLAGLAAQGFAEAQARAAVETFSEVLARERHASGNDAPRAKAARGSSEAAEKLLEETLHSLVDFLCLNEEREERLPRTFDPRGKQIEVHVFAKGQDEDEGDDDSEDDEPFQDDWERERAEETPARRGAGDLRAEAERGDMGVNSKSPAGKRGLARKGEKADESPDVRLLACLIEDELVEEARGGGAENAGGGGKDGILEKLEKIRSKLHASQQSLLARLQPLVDRSTAATVGGDEGDAKRANGETAAVPDSWEDEDTSMEASGASHGAEKNAIELAALRAFAQASALHAPARDLLTRLEREKKLFARNRNSVFLLFASALEALADAARTAETWSQEAAQGGRPEERWAVGAESLSMEKLKETIQGNKAMKARIAELLADEKEAVDSLFPGASFKVFAPASASRDLSGMFASFTVEAIPTEPLLAILPSALASPSSLLPAALNGRLFVYVPPEAGPYPLLPPLVWIDLVPPSSSSCSLCLSFFSLWISLSASRFALSRLLESPLSALYPSLASEPAVLPPLHRLLLAPAQGTSPSSRAPTSPEERAVAHALEDGNLQASLLDISSFLQSPSLLREAFGELQAALFATRRKARETGEDSSADAEDEEKQDLLRRWIAFASGCSAADDPLGLLRARRAKPRRQGPSMPAHATGDSKHSSVETGAALRREGRKASLASSPFKASREQEAQNADARKRTQASGRGETRDAALGAPTTANGESAETEGVAESRSLYPLSPDLCEQILRGRTTESSKKEALGLPVREHEAFLHKFMGDATRRVLVLQGETGSGKTTQIPRILLEAAAQSASGTPSSASSLVLCSQPRRLAAVSVAARVAEEMGTALGGLVGYQIRLETKMSKNSRLIFCTHGVLLRKFLSDRYLRDVSVVVVDEVHERATEVDLLLLLLSRALVHNPVLKVVLMSASVSVEFFASYFRRLPPGSLVPRGIAPRASSPSACVSTLRVSGRTFPVSVFYAEDIRRLVEKDADGRRPSSASAFSSLALARDVRRASRSEGGGFAQAAPGGRERASAEEEIAFASSDAVVPCPLPAIIRDVAELIRFIHGSRPLREAASGNQKPEGKGGDRGGREQAARGAILVFLSGVGEVNSACRACEALGLPLWVLPCHAALQPAQQQKVFQPAPPGLRKVVIATNIAETSVTIPDISFVIDSGLHKQMEFDPRKRLSQLREQAISRSAAQQRAGRAGRVAAGECFRLYEKSVFEKYMKQSETPELQRRPLENVCLQLKAIFPHEPLERILAECIEPPSPSSITSAVKVLSRLGALQLSASASPDAARGCGDEERLTSLGRVLSLFPMDLAFARMLIYSAALSCLDEMTALCALMAVESSLYVSHLVNPEASAARQKYFSRSQSDFITNLRIFFAWRLVQKNRRTEEQFCRKFGVNPQSMRNADELRKRFARVVAEVGLKDLTQAQESERVKPAARTPAREPRGAQADEDPEAGHEEEIDARICSELLDGEALVASLSSEKGEEGVADGAAALKCASTTRATEAEASGKKSAEEEGNSRSIFWYLKACVVAGLYPQVAVVRAPRKRFVHVASGTVEKLPEPWEIKYLTRVEDDERGEPEKAANAQEQLQRVFIHPSSINFGTNRLETQWLAFLEKVQTSKPFIKDVSTVSVFALLLLSCCEIEVCGERGLLRLDGWIELRCPGLIGSYIRTLKFLFSVLLDAFFSRTLSRSYFREPGRGTRHRHDGKKGKPQNSAAASPSCLAERSVCGSGLFEEEDGQRVGAELISVVKKLVEFEGHKL
ncbi:DEAD/DEAH box helicase domain-containing protein [Besnoitia besnoiti]|uniref:DEAD/DEAH box helicase domain-containing protein n=1 Tax=Besnoitia besnoiti TaxID=94643 RepID=A0A2A9M8C4_BESBE|nr:DEAD/DEAH box helicase domain-containing protein [Besnoitia besnoiti]PFH33414.1 DEAD/DEAH box helicase domain-containing protein [Besnoitia besnoiti]